MSKMFSHRQSIRSEVSFSQNADFPPFFNHSHGKRNMIKRSSTNISRHLYSFRVLLLDNSNKHFKCNLRSSKNKFIHNLMRCHKIILPLYAWGLVKAKDEIIAHI